MTIRESNRPTSRRVFPVVALAVFMTNLDLWIVNVALDDVGRSFAGSTLAHVSWVLNAYAVTLGALLVVAGRAGDRYGHRRTFLAGTALFTLASLACALAPTLDALVAARVVQAAGAALQLPSSLALLLVGVPAGGRVRATRAW
ncbi:MFS transporter, partial [Angustibacter peucedani]